MRMLQPSIWKVLRPLSSMQPPRCITVKTGLLLDASPLYIHEASFHVQCFEYKPACDAADHASKPPCDQQAVVM